MSLVRVLLCFSLVVLMLVADDPVALPMTACDVYVRPSHLHLHGARVRVSLRMTAPLLMMSSILAFLHLHQSRHVRASLQQDAQTMDRHIYRRRPATYA